MGLITTSPLSLPPFLQIETSPEAGRSYHAPQAFAADHCILDASTPYSYTIYKQFRNEVCSECFHYEAGRRGFLTSREYGEHAGLLFCNTTCRDAWIAREGHIAVELLTGIERTRSKKPKNDHAQGCVPDQAITEEEVEKAWEEVSSRGQNPKEKKKWNQIQLDDFEADLARYVLLAILHLARESSRRTLGRSRKAQVLEPGTRLEEPNELDKEANAPLEFGGATWTNFASLQPNAIQQIKLFPELLLNHIRVYEVLKGLASRFGVTRQGRSGGDSKRTESIAVSAVIEFDQEKENNRLLLAKYREAMTVQNVRLALSVESGNSFGIWETPLTEESEMFGFAIYPIPSFFNHHCSPNLRKERDGRRMRFITTTPVSAGDEMCISYGHVKNTTVEERKKTLRDGWYFDCECSRCRSES